MPADWLGGSMVGLEGKKLAPRSISPQVIHPASLLPSQLVSQSFSQPAGRSFVQPAI